MIYNSNPSDMLSLEQLLNLNINYYITMENIIMESNNYNQSINGNNNSASINVAGGNIISNISISGESVKDINEVIETLKKLFEQEQLDGLEK